MRCAWTCPSSWGGVSQFTLTCMPYFADSSFAAESAPVRAARNTGLVELFAIIAMVILFFPPAAAFFAAAAVVSVLAFSPPAHARRVQHATPDRKSTRL